MDGGGPCDAAGVSVRCARKWVTVTGPEGEAVLRDRSSAPLRVANRYRRGTDRGDYQAPLHRDRSRDHLPPPRDEEPTHPPLPAARKTGKAERLIRPRLNHWVYGASYGSSRERTADLGGRLWHYNDRRDTQPSATNPGHQSNPLGFYS